MADAAIRIFPPLPEDTLLPRSFDRSLPIALMKAREAVMLRFRPLLLARDVTEQQWRVIRVLSEENPLDATEVAARANILAPSLTRIIRSLEDRQLIARQRNEADHRKVMLTIAPAGIALIHDFTPEASAIYRELVLAYGPERMDLLLDMLNDLTALKF